MTKEELRRSLKRERAQVPKDQRKEWDEAIQEALYRHPAYRSARRAMIYLSFGWEIDTWPIVDQMLAQGKEVYVPVVQKSPKALQVTLFRSREELVPAVFGILEPKPGTPTIPPQELDLVVVPGIAFSPEGYRIGYGGGYYDRFLTQTRAITLGLVYSSFIRELEPDPWDQPVDFLVTELD